MNGAVAAALGLLCVTGLMIWWPGVSDWRKRLRVDWSKSWKRMIWELHGAVGVWMAALLLAWAVSGINFIFPGEFQAVVARFGRLTVAPKVLSNPTLKGLQPRPDPGRLMAAAQRISPTSQLVRITFPTDDRGPIVIRMTQPGMTRSVTGNSVSYYFDQFSGELLYIWDQTPRTAGDLFMSWLAPLHLGTFGGTASKGIWAVLGLSPCILFVTGASVWWNRVVSDKWARLRRAA